jgi:hypothetical protein
MYSDHEDAVVELGEDRTARLPGDSADVMVEDETVLDFADFPDIVFEDSLKLDFVRNLALHFDCLAVIGQKVRKP